MIKYQIKVTFKNSDKNRVGKKTLSQYRLSKLANKAKFQLQGEDYNKGRITGCKQPNKNTFVLTYNTDKNGLKNIESLKKSLSNMYSFKSLVPSKA